MISPDMDFLARKINELESQHKGTRAAQLPQSSIVTPGGDDLLIGEAAENAQDALAETGILGEDLSEVGDNVDSEAEYATEVPSWIVDAGGVGDMAWEAAQEAADRVDAAQAEVDLLASDLLVVSQESAQAAADALEAQAKADAAVAGTVVEYATSAGPETEPTTGWSTVRPAWVEGTWIWSRTTTVYGNGDTTVGDPVPLTGPAGAPGGPGDDGRGIASTEVRYQASASGIIEPTGAWLADVPIVPAGHFLWTRTVITYTDSTTSTAFSVSKVGEDGQPGGPGAPGRGIVSTTITYQGGASGTTEPTGTWSPTVPSVPEGQYLWTRTVITYTSGDPTTTYSVARMGEDGQPGAPGSPGSPGNDGVSITTLTRFYWLGTSQPGVPTASPPPAPWMATEPAYTAGSSANLYEVTRTIKSDGTWSYGPVSLSASFTAAKQAYTLANSTKFLAEGLYQTIPSVTEPTTSPTGALKQGDQWWKIDSEGRWVGVGVWNGSTWQDRQMVADSLLVPGSVGAVLIGDGAITAPKLSVDALDFKTGRGMNIFGAYIEGGEFSLADAGGFGLLYEDECENTWGPTIIGTGTLSTDTNYKTRSIQLTDWIVCDWVLYDMAVNSDSYIEMNVWSTKPTFDISYSSRIPGINDNSTVTVTPNTWTTVTVPVNASGEIWGFAITPSDFEDSGTLRVSRVRLFGPFEYESGVTISRTQSGNARIESTTDDERTIIQGGLIHLDLPQAPGAGSTTLGHSAIQHMSSNSRFSILAPYTSSGLGIDIVAGESPQRAAIGLTPMRGLSGGSYMDLNADTINSTRKTKVLWSGVYYLTDKQTATLSELVSEQLTGIVLAWSGYVPGGSELNYNWQYTFIPKEQVARHNGQGSYSILTNSLTTESINKKYYYVHDTHVSGNANNTAGSNNQFVLRYIFGV